MAENRVSTGFLFNVEAEGLDSDCRNHIAELGKEFCLAMADKYTKGVREHGGHLWDVSEEQLLEMAIEEAIDQVVYLLTLRGKRHGIRS